MTTITFRQQDEKYSVYPATVRDRLNVFMYGIMNLKMKNLARDMVTKDDAVERCHDWLSHEMRRLWKASYERDANSEIYERVGREMLGEIADLVYGADTFDKLFGIVKLEEAV
jgi:hypothetical protein